MVGLFSQRVSHDCRLPPPAGTEQFDVPPMAAKCAPTKQTETDSERWSQERALTSKISLGIDLQQNL